jgi:hypothetical protein
MREIVAIWYRGANYQIGRGRDFYGIWPMERPAVQPLEWWPLTGEGWFGAWSRFVDIETPGTIVPGDQPAQVTAAQRPAGPVAQHPAMPVTPPAAMPVAPTWAAPVAPTWAAPVAPPGAMSADPPAAIPAAWPAARLAGRDVRAVIAAALLAVGVGCGIAGLFPAYLGVPSLAQEPAELVPHVIYLAGWSASALLILLGGARLRIGALLGTGVSIVTFGFFFADVGTVIADGAHLVGAGLVLGLIGWLACATGSAMALPVRPPGVPGAARRYRVDPLLILTLAGLGAAIAFAPAWDRYTLHFASGVSQTVTAGNAFANPAPVIAGDVAVMVTLVAVVVAAALWRPVWQGAALLAGAIIPMAAQAVSALVQLGEGTSPALFGISSAQAAQAGLTISSGATPAFWIYCAFVIVLAAMCVRMFLWPRSAGPDATASRPPTLGATPPTASTFG